MSYDDHEWVASSADSDIAWCRRCGIPIDDHKQPCGALDNERTTRHPKDSDASGRAGRGGS